MSKILGIDEKYRILAENQPVRNNSAREFQINCCSHIFRAVNFNAAAVRFHDFFTHAHTESIAAGFA